MALINCPECGHKISDKAAACPSCGIKIAGNITCCPSCRHTYLTEAPQCPKCSYPNISKQHTPPPSSPAYSQDHGEKRGKGKKTALITIMAAIVIGAAGLYYHQHLKAGREFEEYRLAAQSNDINVVEQYLKAFPDAPQQHINAINARKGKLLQEEQDWKNALASQSTSIVQHYIDTHQDGRFLDDALGQLDSLDWETSKMADSDSAYQKYLEKHPDGKYFNEAEEAIRAIKNRIVTPEETLLVRQIFHQFFLAINEKNEAKLATMVNNILSTFLGKNGATKTDVLDFMKRIYKEDVVSMLWRVDKDLKINKREVGKNEYEYGVEFRAFQSIDRKDTSKERFATYKVTAKVSPDGKISEFNMNKIQK